MLEILTQVNEKRTETLKKTLDYRTVTGAACRLLSSEDSLEDLEKFRRVGKQPGSKGFQ